MRSHQTHIILLLLSSALSIFLIIAGAKYAEWSHSMVIGQVNTHWLALVFYVGTAPALSLIFTTTSLAAYHFGLIPTPPSSTPTTTPISAVKLTSSPIFTPYTWSASATTQTTLTVLLFTLGHTVMWLIQSAFQTACELGPIASGHQGDVPSTCPQSNFHDNGDPSTPIMLSQLALGKDILSWLMIFLSLAMAECARRGWMKARVAESEEMYTKGMGYANDGWKNGVVISNTELYSQPPPLPYHQQQPPQPLQPQQQQGPDTGMTLGSGRFNPHQHQQHQQAQPPPPPPFELSSVPTWKSYETKGTRDAEIAAAVATASTMRQQTPSPNHHHPGNLDRLVTPLAKSKKRGEVAVNLGKVGMGYESRV